MRSLEIVLAFAVVFAIAWPVVFGIRPRRGIVAAALTAGFIAQVQVEGFRWQLVPMYAIALGLAGGDIFFIDRELKWTNRVARGLFGLAGVGLAVGAAAILPVPELPVPSGPHAIGTFTVELVDSEREEIYGPAPGSSRRIMAQVWYPATSSDSVGDAIWSEDWDVVAPALSRQVGLPSWFLDHSRYVDSHAKTLAPVADGVFPVVVYSHGWTGFRTIALNQFETLASNGYIVIAPDHTYGSIAVRFPDGEVELHDPMALPEEGEVDEEAYQAASELLVETFAGDISTVLNELERGDEGAFALVASRADLTRVGVYGHSTGGGAAVRVCLEDERCDAVLGMDAWVEPLPDKVLEISATMPTMFLRSEEWRETENDSLVLGIAGRSLAVSYILGIEGADHNDFTVAPLLSPLGSQLGLKGSIPAGRILPILDNYLLGFFDVYLLGTGPASLDTVTFDEVSVEILHP